MLVTYCTMLHLKSRPEGTFPCALQGLEVKNYFSSFTVCGMSVWTTQPPAGNSYINACISMSSKSWIKLVSHVYYMCFMDLFWRGTMGHMCVMLPMSNIASFLFSPRKQTKKLSCEAKTSEYFKTDDVHDISGCSVSNTALGFLSYFILAWGRLDKLLTDISKKSWQQETWWCLSVIKVFFRTEIRSFNLEKIFFNYYTCFKRFSTTVVLVICNHSVRYWLTGGAMVLTQPFYSQVKFYLHKLIQLNVFWNVKNSLFHNNNEWLKMFILQSTMNPSQFNKHHRQVFNVRLACFFNASYGCEADLTFQLTPK